MIYSFKDISTVRRGTLTRLLINKKSIENKNIFNIVMVNFRGEKTGFNYLIPSTINLKYYTRLNVVETEKLFNEVRKIYFDKLKNNKGGNLIGR
jgi:flagellar assembly factor FliW